MKGRLTSMSLTMLLFTMASFSCGIEDGSLPVGLDIQLSRLEGDETLQFVVLADRDRNGNDLECDEVIEGCIGDQPRLRVRPLQTPEGSACAYREPLDLEASMSPDGQPVSIPGIPPGSGYLVVVELARQDGRREERIGAGCIPVERITRGTNPTGSPIDVREASACLPTLDEC